ncbi:MAG TPA: polysaccharide biosynthesis tyrosine autokinase, partial [Longimicrobium sp.]
EGVVDLRVEGSTQVAQAAQVQAEQSALQAEQAALAGLLANAGRAAALQGPDEPSAYRRLAAFPALMRNQSTAEVLASLSRLDEQRTTLLTRRRPTDPEVQIISERIGQVEGQLRALAETYLASLDSNIASMDGTLGEVRGRLDRIPAREVQLARLSRQPQVLAEMYALLQTRLKEAEIAQAVEDASVRVIDPAVLSRAPVSPRTPLIVGAALLLGLLGGLGLAYARDLADETVHTRGDLELAAGGVPVLALVPRLRGRGVLRGAGGARGLLPRATPAAAVGQLPGRAAVRPGAPSTLLLEGAGRLDPVTDAYDWLHTSLLFSRPDGEPRTLLVTSALPGDGKTTTAVNFALTLAQRGMRVLLIDADLRRGGVGQVLSAADGPGLAEVLAGTARCEEAMRTADAGNDGVLCYIPCGGLPRHPQQLLRSPRMAALLAWAAREFDRVIVDTPPLNVVADAALLGPAVDGVVLVARAGVTPFGAVSHVAEHMRQARMCVLGTVMNDVDFAREGRYDQAYRWYGYGREYYAAGRAAVGAA